MAEDDATGGKPASYQQHPVNDADLLKPGARLAHGVESAPNEATAGQYVALQKIKTITGLSLSMTDFDISVRARNIRTGKWNEPVEWVTSKDGKFRGDKGVWEVQLNLDDPDSAHPSPASPSGPHVGYTVIFCGDAVKYHREKGHIMVASVDATRPPLPLRKDARQMHQTGQSKEADRIFDQYFLRRR